MRVKELENEVFDKDEIRIVVRARGNTEVGEYEYERKAADNTSLSDWLEQRIVPLVGDNRVTVIDGHGAVPHGRTRLGVVRETYFR
jgi:hypothetical protein